MGAPTSCCSASGTGSWTAAAPRRRAADPDAAPRLPVRADDRAQSSPPRGWQPALVDYLYTSFTNATAFSPTDTMPLTPTAKCADGRPVADGAGDDRSGRGPSRQHPAADGARPGHTASPPPPPARLGADHLRRRAATCSSGATPVRARRSDAAVVRETTARAGTAACAATAGWRCPAAAGRRDQPAGPDRDRGAAAGQGAARPDRAAADRGRPRDSFRRARRCSASGCCCSPPTAPRCTTAYYRILTALQGGVAGGPVQTSGHVGILRDLDKLFSLQLGHADEAGRSRCCATRRSRASRRSGCGCGKRWAEYLTFIATDDPAAVGDLRDRPRGHRR